MMDAQRHNKTQKKWSADQTTEKEDTFRALMDDSAREAYSRPWHRIERGLRLNRLRLFIEEISPQYGVSKEEKDGMSKEEKDAFFLFLQKSLDKKLLNTLKVVVYDQEKQRITAIRGLEIKRNDAGLLKYAFQAKTPKVEGTRKKKKEEVASVQTKIEE
jgi:hypothetical protein